MEASEIGAPPYKTKDMKFEDIKVGDTVIISSPWNKTIGEVVKVTKTTFCTEKARFRRDDGRLWGTSRDYCTRYAKKATEEEIRELRIEATRQKLYFKVKGLLEHHYPSLEDLKEIHSILNKYVEQNQNNNEGK